MKHIITAIFNQETRLYDICVLPEGHSVVLEVIASCKDFENASWIIDLINKERGCNEK